MGLQYCPVGLSINDQHSHSVMCFPTTILWSDLLCMHALAGSVYVKHCTGVQCRIVGPRVTNQAWCPPCPRFIDCSIHSILAASLFPPSKPLQHVCSACLPPKTCVNLSNYSVLVSSLFTLIDLSCVWMSNREFSMLKHTCNISSGIINFQYQLFCSIGNCPWKAKSFVQNCWSQSHKPGMVSTMSKILWL
jgi:hypothetical protein